MFKYVLTALIAAVTAASAQASILLGPAVTYQSVKSTDNTGFAGGNQNSNALGLDGHLGILIEGTIIYIGGVYDYLSNTPTSDTKITGTEYGPTLGIFDGAFSILGTYLMSGQRTYTAADGTTATLAQGTGWRADITYVAGFGPSLGVGPQLTYRTMKYAKSTPSSGTETSNTYEESSIYPSLVFWFRF